MRGVGIASLFTTADKILFLFSFILITASFFYFWQSSPANYAVIKSTQQDALIVNLSEPRLLHIQGNLGVSTLEVKQGQIRFVTSPCKNKLCIQSGWHHHGGAVTACLPNRISVQLASHASNSRYDAIIF